MSYISLVDVIPKKWKAIITKDPVDLEYENLYSELMEKPKWSPLVYGMLTENGEPLSKLATMWTAKLQEEKIRQ